MGQRRATSPGMHSHKGVEVMFGGAESDFMFLPWGPYFEMTF